MNETKFHYDNVYCENPIQYGAINLFQIGDCCTISEFEIELHKQACLEISYIVSGSVNFIKNNISYTLTKGDVFICNKDDLHAIKSINDNPVRFLYMGFEFKKEHEDYKNFIDIEDLLKNVHVAKFNNNDLYAIFSCVFNEISGVFSMRDFIIKNLLEQIIYFTYKNFYYININAQIYSKKILDKKEIVYNVINYLENNYLSITNISTVSNYINFSYSYLSKLFKDVVGVSLGNYYKELVFKKAVQLLSENVSVTQTAEILGFESVHSFSRSFKNRFNISPKKYIHQLL